MNVNDVRRAITPLTMIFWGGLLCFVDWRFTQTSGGRGFRFDILNDALGTILIAVGVSRLREIDVHRRYAAVMKFVFLVSVVAVLEAINDHFVRPTPTVVQCVQELFSLLTDVAIVAFCVAMRWFCQQARLTTAAQSWLVTTILIVIIYLIPLGLCHIAGLYDYLAGRTVDIDVRPAGILLLVLFAIPFIHLLVSIVRMKRAAEEASAVSGVVRSEEEL